MKIAIIADIHGNIHALDAVLADIQTLGVDEIIVNGDMVNRGPSNDAVMERLSHGSYTITLGNHDALMVNWFDHHEEMPNDWYDTPFWRGMEWCVTQLEQSGYLNALRELPMVHEIAIDGAPKILVTHGSPRHYREGYGPFLSAEKYFEIIEEYPSDIYIGSHTHRTDEREVDGKTFINTGAVGAPFNGDSRAQYLLLTLKEDMKWKWEFRAVPYDRAAALAAYDSTGLVPYGDLSAHIFKMELEYALPIYAPYWSWAEHMGKPLNWETWDEFLTLFGDKLVLPSK